MSLLWRAGRGLWAVALLSAATIPVLLHVATLHRGHWSGSAGVDFWGMLSPAAVALLGLTVEQQLAILDVSANGLGLTVSNRTSSVFGITH